MGSFDDLQRAMQQQAALQKMGYGKTSPIMQAAMQNLQGATQTQSDAQKPPAGLTPTLNPGGLSAYGPNPDVAGLPKFTPVSAAAATEVGGAYQAKDMSKTALPQYDAMRTRLNTQYSQTQGQAQDALDRQFAAMGGGPGNGAQAKQTENLAAGIAQQKGQDLESINAQEAQARTDLQNQESQREFQSGEAQKGYQFQAGESAAQRGQAAQEFNQQTGFQQGATIAGLNQAYQESQAEYANNQFNQALAIAQQKWTQQNTGGLFGSGGFLGLGI